MKVTIEKIINAQQAFAEISGQPMNTKTACLIADMVKVVQIELDKYNEQRVKLLQDIGSTLSDDGIQYNIPMNKRQEFAEKFAQLISNDVEIPDKIDLSNEKLNISPISIIELEPFMIFNAG